MKVLLHFENWQGVETRYVLEPVKVALNSKPSQAVVQSFVPPNTPSVENFEGEVLKLQYNHEEEGWGTSEKWYILPGVKSGKIYNEYGGLIGVNITSPELIIKREKDFWGWWDGTSYFKGERVLKEPREIFVS